jgi:peptidoglycan/xylan/chitin deacetylase (PgdA/CDA1 family)
MSVKRSLVIGLSVVYLIVTRLCDLVVRLLGGTPASRFVVLYYHSVPAGDAVNFARQMETVAQLARVVPADHVGRLEPGRHYIAITFDDALQSIADYALPVLRALSLHATIFIPSGMIGRSPDWEDVEKGDRSLVELEPVMTLETLRRLPTELVTLGCHSMSHPRLPDIDAARLTEELTVSRAQLAELLGRPVRLFAFPYGAYDHRVVEECRRAGYERVFSIVPLLADPDGTDYVRGRVSVGAADMRLEFHLKIRGAYAWRQQVTKLRTFARAARANGLQVAWRGSQ